MFGASLANAASFDVENVTQNAFNPIAVTMFLIFVLGTLLITYYSNKKAKAQVDFTQQVGILQECKMGQQLLEIL